MWKLKIGIGRPPTRDQETVAKYVMESFSEPEIVSLMDVYLDIYTQLLAPLTESASAI